MSRFRVLSVLVVAACAGCSWLCAPLPGGRSGSTRPFADVPPPPRCELVWSNVYESSLYRCGTLIYKGRPSADEVVEYYRREMPKENWNFKEKTGAAGILLRYTKTRRGREHCDIAIGETGGAGSRCIVINVMGLYSK